MKHFLLLAFSLSLFFAEAQLPMQKTYTYHTNIFDDGGSEIVAYDARSQRFFSTNGSTVGLDIIETSGLSKGKVSYRGRVDLSAYLTGIQSVAAANGLIAVAGLNSTPQAFGKVVFLDTNGTYLAQVTVGYLPDMLTFYGSGGKLIVANEGEPSDDYAFDPIGSISLINIPGNVGSISQADVTEINFTKLDTTAYDPNIRIFGNNGMQLPSQDLEPEYIAINSTQSKAYVSLQENNAVAIIDLVNGTLDTVVGFGYKDLSVTGNGIDASNTANNINIRPYERLFGMYQPDAIAAFNLNGNEYFISANEGDARDYSAYSEETRIKDVLVSPFKFTDVTPFLRDTLAGRLNITTSMGDNDNDGIYDSLFCFGARSFSVWNENAQLVWDSGDEFEQIIAQAHPDNFNSNNDDNNSRKSRSDDKGPEPEAIAYGVVDGTPYAFIGLERMGGIMVYDMTDPANPTFVQYELNRDFTKPETDPDAGDLGPEGITFVPANQSANGIALLAVANEISGTVTIYQLGVGIGVEETAVNRSIDVYPNPSTGVFEFSEPLEFKVFDMQGNVITSGNNVNSLDLSSAPAGVYLVKDKKGNAVRLIKK
jgi:hypothetical protein